MPTLGYIAQLVKPPKDIIRIGMNSVMKVLRLAGNSLSYRTAFSFDTLGGPKFPDIVLYINSCLIRTACRTVSGHEELHCSLLRAGIEALPFANHRFIHAIPDGWDAPAFCSLSVEASLRLPIEISRSQNDGVLIRGSLQAKIFKHLSVSEDVRGLAWRKLLGERLSTLCPDEFEEKYVLSEAHFKELCKVLMTLGPGPRLCVIKTLVNSWATSCRMGESVDLPGFFCGLDMEDDLTHYLECDSFWISRT